ncbi:MAG TPA: shikimate kinase [Dehalococcoidia bacterium]|nr:shikimate kinase [Dehalococcoidia bacterium]
MYDQIWLTGFMATGKSRVVRPLAAALDWQAVDTDTLIEQDAHDSVPGIFRAGGEAAFRVIESRVVERVAEMEHVVVATGGGTVLADANRAAMRRRGFVVCLDARPETIASRIADSGAHASERPLLDVDDPLAAITALKAERQHLYAQADFIIQTDDMTPDQVTHQVLLAFRERSAVAGGAA